MVSGDQTSITNLLICLSKTLSLPEPQCLYPQKPLMPVCSKDSEIIGACGLGVGSEPDPSTHNSHGRWASLCTPMSLPLKPHRKIHTSLNGLTSCKFWFLCIFLSQLMLHT